MESLSPVTTTLLDTLLGCTADQNATEHDKLVSAQRDKRVSAPPSEFDIEITNVPAVIDEPEDTEEEVEKRRRGRPRGSIAVRKQATKSSVTQQRLALEAGIRDHIEHPHRLKLLRDAIDRTLRIAAYAIEDKDAVSAMRVLLEKFVSTAKQEEEATGAAPPQIRIVIENATVKPPAQVIDAEFTETSKGKS